MHADSLSRRHHGLLWVPRQFLDAQSGDLLGVISLSPAPMQLELTLLVHSIQENRRFAVDRDFVDVVPFPALPSCFTFSVCLPFGCLCLCLTVFPFGMPLASSGGPFEALWM